MTPAMCAYAADVMFSGLHTTELDKAWMIAGFVINLTPKNYKQSCNRELQHA
jgi:hypothetical protein